jgi:hypothetical protein
MKNKFLRHFLLLSLSLIAPSVIAITLVLTPEDTPKKILTAFAQETVTNANSCSEMSTPELQERCENNQIQARAKKEKNLQICEQITNGGRKRECINAVLYSIALSEGKFENCSSIQSSFLKQKCEKEKEKYVYSNAASLQDCEQITSPETRKTCEEKFVNQEPLSPKQCEQISSKTGRESCLKLSLANLLENSESFSICKEFTGDMQEECKKKINQKIDLEYKKIAIKKGKASICNGILSSKDKEECKDAVYYQLAWTEKNSRYCMVLQNEENIKSCREEYEAKIDLFWLAKAMRENNPSLCENIFKRDLQNECTQSIKK